MSTVVSDHWDSMRFIPNKAFSDWYDALPVEPTYQQTFEAGHAMRLDAIKVRHALFSAWFLGRTYCEQSDEPGHKRADETLQKFTRLCEETVP